MLRHGKLTGGIAFALLTYGRIKLGRDQDEPEFFIVSWLTIPFDAGTAKLHPRFGMLRQSRSHRPPDGALFTVKIRRGPGPAEPVSSFASQYAKFRLYC